MTMDPGGAPPRRRPDSLTLAVSEVAGRRFGHALGRRFAKPLARELRDIFGEDSVRTLAGGVDNPLAAFAIDTVWVAIADLNPGTVTRRDGETMTITDEAWEGFVLGLQQELKERDAMARRTGTGTPGGATGTPATPPTPPPPPKPHPIGEAVIKVAVDLITNEKKLRRTAKKLNAQAEVTRDEARGLEAINNKRTTFWDWLVQAWRDLMSIFN